MKDIDDLQKIKVESCVVGKAIYEGKISIEEVKDWNLKALISF
jgi:phosphoribosylformimino-5-aminoimidazole carboxamide ribotide isomerase